MSTLEGCAAGYDSNGELLFYTDGTQLWSAAHALQPFPPLGGNNTSAQSALVVTDPANARKFHLFTVGTKDPTAYLSHSVLDVAPSGAITLVSGPTVIADQCEEKITAVPNYCGGYYWILSNKRGSNVFVKFRLHSTGVVERVADQAIGYTEVVNYPTEQLGFVKASPDGKRLAQTFAGETMTDGSNGRAEYYDFDPETGAISNSVLLTTIYDFYGLSFSPNARFLYTTGVDGITQFDLASLNPPTSGILCLESLFFHFGDLQVGPD
ncbi:MAG: hypothetical protein ACK5XP_12870, partial [Sphingobacteriia bacterium]